MPSLSFSVGAEQARRNEEQAVGPLLARAKLLRVRGQWDEAISLCAEAMRRYPNSLTARSLLGEIHEAQNRLEDAAQWFAMALDIAPDSHKDRASLDRVLSAQRLSRTQDTMHQARLKDFPTTQPRISKRERTLEWWDRTFPPGRSESIARMILAVSGAVTMLLMVSAGAIWFLLRNGSGPFSSRIPQPVAESLPSPLLAPDPIVVQPPPAATTKAAPSVKLPTPSAPVERSASSVPGRILEMRERVAEDAAFASNLSGQVSEAFRIVNVERDRDNRSLTVSILLPAMTEASDNTRERIVRAAVRTARIAAFLDRNLQSATISASVAPYPEDATLTQRLTAPALSNVPAFQGVIPVAALRATPVDFADSVSVADLLMRFRRSQWNDALSTAQSGN